MKVPSKVKIFIWRALHGITPLKCILANRHVGTSASCPICGVGPEDVVHLLFLCPAARELWEAIGILDIISDATQTDRSCSVVLEVLLRGLDNMLQGFENVGLKETIMVACWYLWWIRRRRTHNESVPPMFRCKMSILSIVANSAKASKVQGNSETVKWLKSEPRYIKLNVDAAYHEDQRAGSSGAVLRDFEGRFVAASNMLIPHVASEAMDEAIAMKNGLILANRLGWNRIRI